MGGSGGPLSAVPHLAEALGKSRPGIRIQTYPPVGSGGGIRAVAEGALDVALTSRPMTEEEKSLGLVERAYSRTLLVVATSSFNRFPRLTRPLLADILAGRVSTWPNGEPIRIILRPRSDSDMDALRTLSPAISQGLDIAFAREGMAMAHNDKENTSLIARSPWALGISTLAQIVSEGNVLVALPLDGVDPTQQALVEGRYPWSKRFYAVTRGSPADAEDFVRFLLSPQGGALLLKCGQVPLPGGL